MIARPSEKRTSVSLSERDEAAIARLLVRLLDHGIELTPTRLLRALAHVFTESEMLDHARRYLRSDAAKQENPTVHRPVVVLLSEDVTKLKKVRLKLMAGHHGWVWEIDLLRAYWMLPPPVADLAKRLRRFDLQHPDRRTAAGRALGSRN